MGARGRAAERGAAKRPRARESTHRGRMHLPMKPSQSLWGHTPFQGASNARALPSAGCHADSATAARARAFARLSEGGTGKEGARRKVSLKEGRTEETRMEEEGGWQWRRQQRRPTARKGRLSRPASLGPPLT